MFVKDGDSVDFQVNGHPTVGTASNVKTVRENGEMHDYFNLTSSALRFSAIAVTFGATLPPGWRDATAGKDQDRGFRVGIKL